MSIFETPFTEPIYTRRTKFNHLYDITLNEITIHTNKKGFSNFGYCYSLIERVHQLSHHERLLFLRYQLKATKNPMRWLLDFEKLIELNSWETAQEFYNHYENLSIELKDVIRDLFYDVEANKYSSPDLTLSVRDDNSDIIFNTAEACEFLSISKSTLYKLTSSKKISFYKPNGKNMYFKKEGLDDYIFQSKQITNSEIETQSLKYIARKHTF